MPMTLGWPDNWTTITAKITNPFLEAPNPSRFIFARSDIGAENYVLSQKMDFFHYFVYHTNRPMHIRPNQIVSGKWIIWLKKFHDYFLQFADGEILAFADYFFVLGRVY